MTKTTAQNGVLGDSQQQPAPDTSNEGLVYSAVVVKDGKKTTVKAMDTTQNSDIVERGRSTTSLNAVVCDVVHSRPLH